MHDKYRIYIHADDSNVMIHDNYFWKIAKELEQGILPISIEAKLCAQNPFAYHKSIDDSFFLCKRLSTAGTEQINKSK